jgi:hypothetical protein
VVVDKMKSCLNSGPTVYLVPKTYAERLNRLTLQFGITGFSIATVGLGISAFSGNAIYAACSLLLGFLIIAWVHFAKRRLERYQVPALHPTGSSSKVYAADFRDPSDSKVFEHSEALGTADATAGYVNG